MHWGIVKMIYTTCGRKVLSLQSLIKLLQHYVKAIIAVVAVFIVAGAMISLTVVPPIYEAEATVTVSDPSGSVSTSNMLAIASSIAHSEAFEKEDAENDLEVIIEAGTPSAPQLLSIKVQSPSEEKSITTANMLASSVAEKTEILFSDLQNLYESSLTDLSVLNDAEDVASVLSGSLIQEMLGSGKTFEFCSFLVNEADEAESAGLSLIMMIVVSFFVGVLASIVLVVAIDSARCPLRGKEDITAISGLPIVEGASGKDWGERVWVNMALSDLPSPLESVCIVPIGSNEASECTDALRSSFETLANGDCATIFRSSCWCEKENPTVFSCNPLCESSMGVLKASDASAAVVCVRLWRDSRKALKEALSQLRRARTTLVCIVVFSN